jgi:hypothetical protein
MISQIFTDSRKFEDLIDFVLFQFGFWTNTRKQ